MTENSENRCEISFKPAKKTPSSAVCTLKVANFFTLPEYDNTAFTITSPPFEFALATWCFRFSSSTDDDDFYKTVVVHLVRLNSERESQKIFSSIILLDGDDKVYRKHDVIRQFDLDEGQILSFFSNSNSLFDRRNFLTVIIHLVSVEAEEVNADQVPDTLQRGISLTQDFKDVLLNGQDHNITFNVCGKEFKAHRDILQARSEYFHSMLSHDMLEKNSGVIEVPDCDPQAFEQCLFYIYTGETREINEKNMFGLYYVADKYRFTVLKEECCVFIKNSLSVTNICDAIELASKHNDEGLMDFAMSYFTNNADIIWPSSEWQLFMKENYIVANEFLTKSFKKSKDQSAKRFKTS